MIIEYLKRLFSKWFVYLGLLPAIDDLIERYLNISLSIPNIVLYLLAFCAFIYATYQAWNDMRVEKEELEEKLKNPVDYEIKAYAKKIVFDLGYLKNKINKNIEEAEKKISETSIELKELEEKSDVKNKQNEMFYIAGLDNYLEKLRNYSSKKDERLELFIITKS